MKHNLHFNSRNVALDFALKFKWCHAKFQAQTKLIFAVEMKVF